MLPIIVVKERNFLRGVRFSVYPDLAWTLSVQRKQVARLKYNPELRSVRHFTSKTLIEAYRLINRIATGSVSGLAAYFLSLPELQGQLQVPGKTAQNVKDYVLSKARPRIDGEVKVLYNGESSDQN